MIVTKPFKLSAPAILLNAATHGGEVAIDLLEADGQPIAELSGANALVLKNADDIAWRADWKSPKVKRRVGQLVQLRFRLQHATVYGFQLPE